MKIPAIRCIVSVALLLSLAACATNRSTLLLNVPSGGPYPPAEKVAAITSITDSRTFETAPRDPSIPSLKQGGQYSLDAEGKLQAIARKRNGYGKALGDILLQSPQTILSITRELVTNGLREKGYRVLAADEAVPEEALKVAVDIRQFWAWMTPGFWAIDMEAKLETRIEFNGTGAHSADVSAYGKKTAPTGKEGNWQQAYEHLFQDYLLKQKAALDQAPL
ncbi:hypothetical protein [Stenotrophomonas mori]|uniref:Lipoprotein n=1 Tax=Stenotrophomonas mori TaxID=2871096 RepID=A0ABT0SIC5_9GAMM|nr:hypothetical protein [Stenotrophomonas mori]MCL7715090.1 hypothetical protein [Stenotrophomonas mori]